VSSEPVEEGVDAPLTLYMVKRLELAVRAIMDDRLRSRGVTTLQYTALSVLRRRAGLSSAQLARRSFVRPQTMHQLVLSLEQRDLIQRRRDPDNRRVLLISLTRTGLSLLRECEPVVREIEEQMLDGMPNDQRTAFRHGLEHGYEELAKVAHAGAPTE
jgi:DNA-binding MarR family transcriptional regulator